MDAKELSTREKLRIPEIGKRFELIGIEMFNGIVELMLIDNSNNKLYTLSIDPVSFYNHLEKYVAQLCPSKNLLEQQSKNVAELKLYLHNTQVELSKATTALQNEINLSHKFQSDLVTERARIKTLENGINYWLSNQEDVGHPGDVNYFNKLIGHIG